MPSSTSALLEENEESPCAPEEEIDSAYCAHCESKVVIERDETGQARCLVCQTLLEEKEPSVK